MTQEIPTTPPQQQRKVPVPVFQGVPDDETTQAPQVRRAVAAMAGPVFTAPQG